MKIYYAAALIMAFALAIVVAQERPDVTFLSMAEPTPPREVLPPFFVRLPWSLYGGCSEAVTPLDLQFEIIRPQPSVNERRRSGALGELWQRSVFAAETPIVHRGQLLDLKGLRAQIKKHRLATTRPNGDTPKLGALRICSDYEQAFDWVLIILAECRAQGLGFRELQFGAQERYWLRSVQVLGQFYGWDQVHLRLPSSAPSSISPRAKAVELRVERLSRGPEEVEREADTHLGTFNLHMIASDSERESLVEEGRFSDIFHAIRQATTERQTETPLELRLSFSLGMAHSLVQNLCVAAIRGEADVRIGFDFDAYRDLDASKLGALKRKIEASR